MTGLVSMRLRGFEEVGRRLAAVQVDVSRRAVNLGLKDCAEHAAREIAAAAPVGSYESDVGPIQAGGLLRRSIRAAKRRAYQNRQTRYIVGVDSRAWYWKFLEFGVAPHVIKAIRGGTLRVGKVFAKMVRHPGFAAKPFVRPTWDRVKGGLIKRFARHVLDSLKRAQR